MPDSGIPFRFHEYRYSSSDSTKSPASGMAKLGKPSLMSPVGRAREVVCAQNSVFLKSDDGGVSIPTDLFVLTHR